MAVVTPYLLVEDLTKSVGSKVLFSNISFAVNKGQRIALIARNGIGKSTLLDILMGRTDYDSGKITWRKDLKVRYLPQHMRVDCLGDAASGYSLEAKGKEKDPCFLCSWYRRKALFDVAQELGCNKIALGHHKDDLIETLLMNLVFQGSISTIPPLLQMAKMPIQMIRPLCLIEEKDLTRYAELSGYEKQVKLCPLEKASSRAEVKELVKQLEALNPNVRDSIYGAMENIKEGYLPHRL